VRTCAPDGPLLLLFHETYRIYDMYINSALYTTGVRTIRGKGTDDFRIPLGRFTAVRSLHRVMTRAPEHTCKFYECINIRAAVVYLL